MTTDATRAREPITAAMVECWRINYGLNERSPSDAMRWWTDNNGGMAPAGAVAALGLLLQEREELAAEVERVTAERDNYHDSMIDEIAENLRLRELGGAGPDENITAMTERVIRERDSLVQIVTDPENQPSQFGTVTLEMYRAVEAERDALRVALESLCKTHERFSGGAWDRARAALEARKEAAK